MNKTKCELSKFIDIYLHSVIARDELKDIHLGYPYPSIIQIDNDSSFYLFRTAVLRDCLTCSNCSLYFSSMMLVPRVQEEYH